MVLNNKERILRRKLNTFFAVGMLLLYCIFCFVLVPLGNMFANDIEYMNTALPSVIEYIYDLVEIIAIALAYAVSIYSIYRYGMEKIEVPAIIFSAITLFKYISNVFMTWSDVGLNSIDIWSDIISISPFLLELLQYFVVVHIASKILSNHRDIIAKKSKAEKKIGIQPGGDGIYPFKSLFNLGNPMIKSAFWAGIIVAATKVAQRIFYDMFLTIMTGVPQLSEIPGMIIYYSSDILCGLACYFAVIWLLMLFLEKKLRRELYE